MNISKEWMTRLKNTLGIKSFQDEIKFIIQHHESFGQLEISKFPKSVNHRHESKWDRWFDSNQWSKVKYDVDMCSECYRNVVLKDFQGLIISEEVQEYTTDIQQVTGVTSSKSFLSEFEDMNDFAIKRCPGWIKELTTKNLDKMLKHTEIRVISQKGRARDYFILRQWSEDGLILDNKGGSHHFASARYIANKLSTSVPLQARLQKFKLNVPNVYSMLNNYHMFIMDICAGGFDEFQRLLIRAKISLFLRDIPEFLNADSNNLHSMPSIVMFRTDVEEGHLICALLKQAGVYYLNDLLEGDLKKQVLKSKL